MAKQIRQITANWETVLKLGNQFSQSTSLLEAATNSTLQGSATTFELPYLIPGVVCRAFTIELLLKSLVLRERGSVSAVHQFTELFSLLAAASKTEIEAHFEELIGGCPVAQAMKLHEPQISLKFGDVMAAMDRAFEQWRYAFDSNVKGSYGLLELERAVRKRFATLDAAAA